MAGATSFPNKSLPTGDIANVPSDGRVIEAGTMGERDVILGSLGNGSFSRNFRGEDEGSLSPAVLLDIISCPGERMTIPLLPVIKTQAMTTMAPIIV